MDFSCANGSSDNDFDIGSIYGFMENIRCVDDDKEEIDGWKGGTGLTTITMEYDFRKFGDGFWKILWTVNLRTTWKNQE